MRSLLDVCQSWLSVECGYTQRAAELETAFSKKGKNRTQRHASKFLSFFFRVCVGIIEYVQVTS
jgi:hypothetical protein